VARGRRLPDCPALVRRVQSEKQHPTFDRILHCRLQKKLSLTQRKFISELVFRIVLGTKTTQAAADVDEKSRLSYSASRKSSLKSLKL